MSMLESDKTSLGQGWSRVMLREPAGSVPAGFHNSGPETDKWKSYLESLSILQPNLVYAFIFFQLWWQ